MGQNHEDLRQEIRLLRFEFLEAVRESSSPLFLRLDLTIVVGKFTKFWSAPLSALLPDMAPSRCYPCTTTFKEGAIHDSTAKPRF